MLASVLFGLGLGALVHRLVVAVFDGWDQVAEVPTARFASAWDRTLTIGPWIALAVGLTLTAATRTRDPAWSVRRLVALSLGGAGVVTFALGFAELHLVRTLEEGWRPRELWWDGLFHGAGVLLAAGGLSLVARAIPTARAPRRSSAARG